MASQKQHSFLFFFLSQEECDFVEVWPRHFAANVTTKKEEEEMMKKESAFGYSLMLSNKVSLMASPMMLEDLTFKKISEITEKNLLSKKVGCC